MLTGQALTALAAAHLERQRPDLALDLAERAMAVHTETGHRVGMAHSHLALHRMGDDDAAHDHRRLADVLFAELGVDPTAHAPAYLGPTRPAAPTH